MGQTESVESQSSLEPSVIKDARVYVGDLVLDRAASTIQSHGLLPVKLSKNELAILSVLADNVGRAVTKSDLSDAVTGTDGDLHHSVIDTYIKYLHRQLQQAHSAVTIEKVPDVGFRLRP